MTGRPTFHGDFECAAVALVLGGDLAAVAARVSVHYFDDAHLVGVDLTGGDGGRQRGTMGCKRSEVSRGCPMYSPVH